MSYMHLIVNIFHVYIYKFIIIYIIVCMYINVLMGDSMQSGWEHGLWSYILYHLPAEQVGQITKPFGISVFSIQNEG